MLKNSAIFVLLFILNNNIVAQNVKLIDDFESYNNFEIANIGNWTMIDNDLSITYNINEHTFENESYCGSFIIFNQQEVNPPLLGWEAHSGDKFLACFNAVSPPNDDWIFSETFVAGKVDTINFWIKSISSLTQLEKYNVYLMSDTNCDSIVKKLNTGLEYDEAPTEWTEISFIVDNFDGDTLRIGIQCVSDDSYCLQIDDFSVKGRIYDPNFVKEIKNIPIIYPNPSSGLFTINQKIETISVYDLNGIFLFSTSNLQFDLSSYEKGIYFVKILSDNYLYTQKIILK